MLAPRSRRSLFRSLPGMLDAPLQGLPILRRAGQAKTRREGNAGIAAGHRGVEVKAARVLGLVLSCERRVRFLGDSSLTVTFERILDDLLVLLGGGRPLFMGDRDGLTGG